MSRNDIKVTTLDSIPGRTVKEQLGVVMGNTVRTRNAGQDMMASAKNIMGGEVSQYSDLLREARNEALDRLEDTAVQAGADAILGLRFQVTEVMDGVTEILAYGTAVKVE